MTRHTVALMGHAGSYTPWMLTEILLGHPCANGIGIGRAPRSRRVHTRGDTTMDP